MIREIVPKDWAHNLWLFGYDDDDKGHMVHTAYRDLVCPQCGKLDERAARQRGARSGSLRLWTTGKLRRDIVWTDDGQILVSSRAAQVIAEIDGGCGSLLQLADSDYQVYVPPEVSCDLGSAGHEYHSLDSTTGTTALNQAPKCAWCGRHLQMLFSPVISTFGIVSGLPALFTTEYRFESTRGEIVQLFAQEAAVQAMKAVRLGGFEYIESREVL